MSRKIRLCEDLTLDQVHDYFTAGRRITDVSTIPISKLEGYRLNPETGEAARPIFRAVVPSYKRHARDDIRQTKYAEEAKRIEEENMRYQAMGRQMGTEFYGHAASTVDDGISSVSMLEKLADTVSVVTDRTQVASVQLPEGMTEQQAVEVYQQYSFRHEYDASLSITKYREDIIDMVESNQVTIIQGETGSGKTTQVPQFILDHYAHRNQYCNIVVTQPRRIAAMSIARRVCAERNWQLGGICGYQVGMDKVAGSDTRLTYCTTGVLLQKLITGKNMHQYTHVILDEVHERDQDSDFCILVVKKLLRSNSKDVKVILMSATFDSDMFSQYFAWPVGGQLEKAPVMIVEGRSYEVAEYYLEDLKELGRLPEISASSASIMPETIALATSLIENLDNLENNQQRGANAARGSVLVFLPGLEEIGAMDSSLERILRSHKLWIRPLHSTITGEEQVKVFDRPPPGHRKVILSTNIAESSITVSDIKYVIDFCLTKQLVCDPSTNYTCLQLEWASKANCIQRKGRAGRVSNGRVYRLVPHRFWREHIQDYGLPEMQRCPLEQLVLKVKLLDLGEPKAILGIALAPPNLDDIEKTIMLLKEVGALASLRSGDVNPHDGDLTFLGRVLGSLPLDIRLGKLIMFGHVFGALDEMIVISACLSLRSFFAQPFKANIESYKHKFAWANESFSDCIAYYNAFMAWKNRNFLTGDHVPRAEHEWGQKNYIQIRRIHEVDDLVRDLIKRMRSFNICNPYPNRRNLDMSSPEHQLIVKLVLCGAFYPNYFLQRKTDEQMTLREMCGHNPMTTVMIKGIPVFQGALYRKEIENLFIQCNGRRPKVHFEDSRAFVEFTREFTGEPGEQKQQGISSAVYVAVKIRLIRLPLQLPYIDADTVKDRLNQMSLTADDQKHPQDKKRNATGDDSHPPPFVFPAATETIVEVSKSEVVNGGCFWVNFVRDGPARADLHFRVQQCARTLRGTVAFEVGSYVLAPFSDQLSTEYYRARIEKMDHCTANVFFLDYGNYQTVLIQDLRPIDPALLLWPVQAVECVLAHVKPSAIKCPGGEWSVEAKECFEHLVSESEVTYAKIYSIVHGVMHVTLNIKYRGCELNVNEELIRLNFADRTEESYASTQNHLQRERMQLENSDPNRPRKMDLRTVCQMREQEELLKATPKSCGMVFLNGPWNPSEVGFISTTCIGQLRPTRVDRDSVNSVTFDTEPGNTSPRVMVAAFVSLNQAGKAITVRETTLMPHIDGLHGLLALLFCPTAELRTDREKKRYVGALCGLGWDSESPDADPAFPEHDMEVTFDTEFDVEDLKMINGVRIAINLALANDQAVADWGPDAVLKIQKSARQKLLNLIRRPRKSVTNDPYPRVYRWRQVDPRDILHPNVVDMSPDMVLLNLHCGIALNTDSDDEEVEQTSYENKLIHQRYLESKASRSTMPEDIFCELCRKVLRCPEELFFHLRSVTHRQNLPV